MLTKRPPSRLPKQLCSRTSAALRSAASLALSLALLSQTFILGGARAAAQTQPGFDVDEAATAQVQRLPVQPAGGAAADFSALSAAEAKGGDASAYALKDGTARLVEPPPAPPEPEALEAAPVVKSARRGKPLGKSNNVAPASADKLSTAAAPSSTPGTISTPVPPADMQAQSDPGLVAPPDTNGAVGHERVMSTTRANYVVQDKLSGAVLSSVPIDVFWAPTGATNPYNPRALYDPYNHRWLLSAVSDPRSPNSSVLVGVSQTDDPAGAYDLYRFDADENNQLWADYGSLGFNKNWVVVSFNAHNLAGDGFNQGRVLTLDYAALRAGSASAVMFIGIMNGFGGFSMQPAVTYSMSEELQYFVSHLGSGAATYRASRLEPSPDGPVLFIGDQKSNFNFIGGWTQPGGEILPQAPGSAGSRKIDSGDSRVQKAVYRNGSIYYCQTVGLPAGPPGTIIQRTAAQWVRLDSNGDFVEGNRIEDPNATPTNGGKWYAYPSLSVNKFGDLLIGFTQFASNQHPAAGYATHVGGTTPVSPTSVTIYKSGEGYYEKTLTGARNLWGLYSTAQVDPANDRDLWTIQEYAAAPVGVGPNSGRWGTWWARAVPFLRPPSVSITSPANGATFVEGATVTLTAVASDVDGFVTSVEFFANQSKIGDGVQTSPGVFRLTVQNAPAGTYTVTARATDNEGRSSVSAPVTVTVRPVTTLSDDFNDNSTDTAKWTLITQPDMTVVEQNGRLEITTPSTGVGYGGYHARDNLNLTNRRVTVEVVQAARGHSLDTYFVLQDMTTNRNTYLFTVGGDPGNILMRETVNGQIGWEKMIPYDPVQHRFWRIRHDPAAETVFWETSADGLRWTARLTAPRRFAVDNLQARIYAGRYNTTTPPQVAVFDNYRVENNPPSRVLLADDFNDNSRDASKWTIDDPSNSTATAHEQNQRLEIAPSPSQVGYNGFTSVNAYDFTNAAASVEVVQATNPFNPETHLLVWIDGSNYITSVVSGGNLIFQYVVGGGVSRTWVPYSPTTHRFWRIRHDVGNDVIFWETSADGVSWAVRRTAARPIPLTSVRLRLIAGKWTNTNATNPGTAVFDNFRAVREPFEPPTDSFNDNSLNTALWFEYNPGSPSQVREQNGRLEITPNPSTVVYNGIATVNAFSFWNKTVTVEVPQTTSQAGWVETYIMLWLDDNNFYQIVTGAGNLVADVMVNGTETRGVIPYNAAAHRFWRIRHNAAAHTVNFEASGDGVNWTTFRTAPVQISLDGMKFYLGAGAWGTGNSAPGTAVFDGVKLTPNE